MLWGSGDSCGSQVKVGRAAMIVAIVILSRCAVFKVNVLKKWLSMCQSNTMLLFQMRVAVTVTGQKALAPRIPL